MIKLNPVYFTTFIPKAAFGRKSKKKETFDAKLLEDSYKSQIISAFNEEKIKAASEKLKESIKDLEPKKANIYIGFLATESYNRAFLRRWYRDDFYARLLNINTKDSLSANYAFEKLLKCVRYLPKKEVIPATTYIVGKINLDYKNNAMKTLDTALATLDDACYRYNVISLEEYNRLKKQITDKNEELNKRFCSKTP